MSDDAPAAVSAETTPPDLPDDGLVVVVKRDCPTCLLVVPVLEQLADDGELTVLVQDDTEPFAHLPRCSADDDLDVSWALQVTTVPTLVRRQGGQEVARTEGWLREEWQGLTGRSDLGPQLPDFRPGCGSLSEEPARWARLQVRHEGGRLRSRRIQISALDDEMESLFERGFTDGLPVVPPTPERVLRMLDATSRSPDDLVAVVPPDLVECTVEKVAINAVMAGCKPEYLPVVLTAVEAACTDEFNIHGVLATTWFAGPLVVVNGPMARAIGMNSGINALGQGNRANATIGRALQLVIRNVGGGRPGGIDRATLGNPGKYTFCFAEDEEGSPWESLATERGVAEDRSAVTLFAAEGVRGLADQDSRTPESLARTFAACLRTVAHPRALVAFDAMVVVSPEHGRVFAEAGWSKARLHRELAELLMTDTDSVLKGLDGMAPGLDPSLAGLRLPKFRDGGLLITYAGGGAGMFSAIIGSWASGAIGSQPVTLEVRP
ncbi:thioredoxin family protein [Rhabdothermincola salaria]|uniref:thioredoxin family protein n=1 Tax=Rhabdothermincola salaria TaxID=2903142 RepID=UPI001E4E7D4B|nr:thioredoxin family protein [Rhabdothermincola salaria]MCD9623444.1 thioredoxin family protein [Rhabdothermincola salaria]